MREVGQQHVHFAGFDVFHAVGRFGQDEFDFVGAAEQVLRHIAGDFHVKALAFAVRVQIAERRLVAEHADTDNTGGFDACQAVAAGIRCGCRCGIARAGGIGVAAVIAAGGQAEAQCDGGKQGKGFAECHDYLQDGVRKNRRTLRDFTQSGKERFFI